ncbi:MAG: histidinol-phosphatase HisJ family protein [Lachnospiraceae bacterium]|nr:histidinol-phosphatase HisJ family protein [Lachnospiraceae bacterium]
MKTPDFHIHSCFSPDSTMRPAEAVEAAIKSGITDMCFTEHMDLGHHIDSFNRIPHFDEMYASICDLRCQYPNINIHCGIEAGYISQTAKQTAQVLSQQNFDYVLLSTHCVDGLDCYLPESKRGRDKITAYTRYLETLYDSISDTYLLNHYDCIGHIGYIAKCRYYEDNTMPYELFPKLFDAILSLIIKNEKGIEVNTSGIKRAGHVLPHPSVIQRYYELGGRIITIGSDAHTPDRVGANVADTIALIKNCGFKEFTVFNRRVPEYCSII